MDMELFADLFRRIKFAAQSKRTRLSQGDVNIGAMLADTMAAKYKPLLAEQRAERTVDRQIDQREASQSPKRDRDKAGRGAGGVAGVTTKLTNKRTNKTA